MITISVCQLATLETAENIGDLLEKYGRSAGMAGLPKPKADLSLYRALDSSGALITLCAFASGVIIGFALLLVTTNPHYSVPVATMESFFVDEEYRSTGAGLQLLRNVESVAIERGARGMFVNAELNGRLDLVMCRLTSYRHSHNAYFKSFA